MNTLIVLSTCLSISHLKTLPKQEKLVVCLVKGSLGDANKLKAEYEDKYEMLYMEKPQNIIYVVIPEFYSGKNNYKEVDTWLQRQLSEKLVLPSNPGPYTFV